MVIRYHVFMSNPILSLDLVDDQFGSPKASRYHTPIYRASWRPMSNALYSATLLKQDSVSENARGRHDFLMRHATPTLAMILLIGLVLNASSKNICQTSSSEVMLASMTSSGMSSYSFDVSETGWAARKSAKA